MAKSTIEKLSVVAWGSPRPKPHGSKLAAEVDARGARALVRAFHPLGYPVEVQGVWDLGTGKRIAGDWLALHPDGERALLRTESGADLVDIASEKKSVSLPKLLRPVTFSPDGKYAADWLRRNTDAKHSYKMPARRVFDLATGETREVKGTFVLETFLPGGQLATVESNGALTIWDLASGRASGRTKGPKKPMALRCDETGAHLLVSCADGTYCVFETESLESVHEGKAPFIASGDASFDGHHVIGTNTLLDVKTGRSKSHEKGWLKGHRSGGPLEATVALTYPYAAVLLERSVLGPSLVEIWNVEDEKMVASTEVESRIHRLVGAPGQRLLVVHAADTEDEDAAPVLTVLAVPKDLGPAKTAAKEPSAPKKSASGTKKARAKR